MANYYCTIRSNYFKVKDTEKFAELINNVRAEWWTGEDGHVAFGVQDGDPIDSWYDENDDEYSFDDSLQALLEDGQVCAYTEVGHEKLRYISMFTTIITKKGMTVQNHIVDALNAINLAAPNASDLNKKMEY